MKAEVSVAWQSHRFEQWLKRNLGNLACDIECRSKHAGVVEFGSGPAIGNMSYTPPERAIEEWVVQKFGLSGDAARQAAFQVQQHIKKYGTEPNPFMRPALNEAMMHIAELVESGGARGVAEFIVEEAIKNLEANGSIVSGELRDKIVIVEVEDVH